eukprot:3938479-Rhodomonas_salina.1
MVMSAGSPAFGGSNEICGEPTTNADPAELHPVERLASFVELTNVGHPSPLRMSFPFAAQLCAAYTWDSRI